MVNGITIGMKQITKQNKKQHDPTMGIILGGVYEKKDNKREWLVVESFTVYNSEGDFMGTKRKPIYHAIVKYSSAINTNRQTTIIERPNLRMAVDYIVYNFKFLGVDLVK